MQQIPAEADVNILCGHPRLYSLSISMQAVRCIAVPFLVDTTCHKGRVTPDKMAALLGLVCTRLSFQKFIALLGIPLPQKCLHHCILAYPEKQYCARFVQCDDCAVYQESRGLVASLLGVAMLRQACEGASFIASPSGKVNINMWVCCKVLVHL